MIVEAPATDATLVARLRAGDEAAFAEVVQAWTPAMLHVARSFVGSEASAEEVLALSAEVRSLLARALEDLPPRQRVVVGLRDVHGFSAGEVCAALEISAANQRVLLHRGRAQLRQALEDWHRGEEVSA